MRDLVKKFNGTGALVNPKPIFEHGTLVAFSYEFMSKGQLFNVEFGSLAQCEKAKNIQKKTGAILIEGHLKGDVIAPESITAFKASQHMKSEIKIETNMNRKFKSPSSKKTPKI